MTIEDLPDFPLEENSLIGRYPFLFSGSDASVVFSVSAAPMPSDCGTSGGCLEFLRSVTWLLSYVLFTLVIFPRTVCCGFYNIASSCFSQIQWLFLPLNLNVLFLLSSFLLCKRRKIYAIWRETRVLLCKNVHFKHHDGFRGSYF